MSVTLFKGCSVILLVSTFLATPLSFAQQTWRGLTVEPENRCSPYNKKRQYPYSQNLEDKIIAKMGGYIYGPYTGRYFESDTQTDIEHIVAASEGHDSGLCSASAEKRKQFATDLLNLTLAAPEVNRCRIGGKCGLDAAEWLPKKNKCWFANRVVAIKTKYGLSVDRAEAYALEAILVACKSINMIFSPKSNLNGNSFIGRPKSRSVDALLKYDDNRNGRISCSEARSHGIAPVTRQHLAYRYMRDSDGDGVICE